MRTSGFEEAADLVDVEDVEMREGFVDEHEAAAGVLIHQQADQQDHGLHDLLAARGLAVVEADHALLVEIEAHRQRRLGELHIVIGELRMFDFHGDAGEFAERAQVLRVAPDRALEYVDVAAARTFGGGLGTFEVDVLVVDGAGQLRMIARQLLVLGDAAVIAHELAFLQSGAFASDLALDFVHALELLARFVQGIRCPFLGW